MKRKIMLLAGLVIVLLLTACGKKNEDGKNTDSTTTGTSQEGSGNAGEDGYGEATIEDLRAAVAEELGDNYWPKMSVSVEDLSDMIGITEDLYDEYLAEMPMISTHVDTLIIIKAKEGEVEAVEEILSVYRDKLINDSIQYPMNLGKIQASRLETYGNYVCFVQLGADVSDALEKGEDAVIEQCQAENEKALAAISNTLSK